MKISWEKHNIFIIYYGSPNELSEKKLFLPIALLFPGETGVLQTFSAPKNLPIRMFDASHVGSFQNQKKVSNKTKN